MAHNKVLIVDDQEDVRRFLVRYLHKKGFEPIEASSGEEALELFKAIQPASVVSDIMMPEMDGIELLESIKAIDPSVVVILITGYGSEDVVLKALRKGANNFFKKPFQFRDIEECIKNALKYREEDTAKAMHTSALAYEKKNFIVKTKEANVMPIIRQITFNLNNFLASDEHINIKIGIEEIMTNAIEHGNLGITSKEKEDTLANATWGKLVNERMESEGGEKLIMVSSELYRDRFTVDIEDEGEGFNWKALESVDPVTLMDMKGRGVFLVKVFFDEVNFNENGNKVTLVKYLQ